MNNLTKQTYESFIQYMKVKRYSANTIGSYSKVIYNFLEWSNVAPSRLTKSHFSEFVILKSQGSHSTQNRYVSALKLFYFKQLGKQIDVREFERPRKKRSLPKYIVG